ncbi:hypothetical protein TNCV_145671 [Trichonephila clavipes]|nr:hypothetical protein TNCV_145671 [Trichonephila clavipes]
MIPCNFYLFPNLKEPLRGRRFYVVSSLRHTLGRSVADINNQYLSNGLQRLPDICGKVKSFSGDYVDGM